MVRVRFAPSPTGFLHVGSARTAIFNWLFARHTGGKFLLRVEDTDLKRSDSAFLDEILNDLKWLGIDWDEEPVFQSRRFALYKEKAEELAARGKAYKEGEAVIFPVPKGRTIEVDDIIHRKITFQTEMFKDQVLIKSDGSPAYNFSCVVDDAEMGITHILRGDDHISNTPKQILFYEALDLAPPRFGHMPLILGADGAKLSKRHGGVSVEEYRKLGYLPEALANYLMLLGWTPAEGREVIPPDEAVEIFEISALNDVQAKFDLQKLRWLNGEYIMRKRTEELLPLIKKQMLAAGLDPEGMSERDLLKILNLYQIRLKTLSEFVELADYFFKEDFAREEKGVSLLEDEKNKVRLGLLADRLENLERFDRDSIEKLFRDFAEEQKLKAGDVIHPSRMAVSGKTRGAGLFEIMEQLGRERVVRRMRSASHG